MTRTTRRPPVPACRDLLVVRPSAAAPAPELVPIEHGSRIGDDPAVLATRLHVGLGVRKKFADWLPVQIRRARLLEGRDYVSLLREVLPLEGKNRGGRPGTDYLLTLRAAMHIAMMAGTDRGFEVRDYFIAAEREMRRLTTGGTLNAAERLGRLERDRELIESAGSSAGRTLGTLRQVRRASDQAITAELARIQPDLLGLEPPR